MQDREDPGVTSGAGSSDVPAGPDAPGAAARRGRRVGIKEVAVAAGVSWKTVSNVVNGTGRVGAATRERVEKEIVALGYRPNVAGRQLRQGRTSTLSLAVPWVHSPYFSALAHRVIDAASVRGYRVLIEETRTDREAEIRVARGFDVHAIDGIIFSPLAIGLAEIDEVRGETPMVLLGERDSPGRRGARRTDHVGIDNVVAAREVTEHLLSTGRGRLAFLGGDPSAAGDPEETRTLRVQGFLDAHAARGGTASSPWVVPVPEFSRVSGARAVDEMLPRISGLDGIVCANDELALGALWALRTNGVRVPHDLAVTGWDNIEDGRFSNPGLTTVAPDLQAIADAAVERVVLQIERAEGGGPAPEATDVVVPHRVLVRESSRDPWVAAAGTM